MQVTCSVFQHVFMTVRSSQTVTFLQTLRVSVRVTGTRTVTLQVRVRSSRSQTVLHAWYCSVTHSHL